MTDFDHIEDVIDDFDEKIEIEYGRTYDELTEKEKNEVLVDIFFKGNSKYNSSAEKLRLGVEAYNQGEIENFSRVVKVRYKSGKSHYQIREANGRFGKWIR